MNRCKNHGDTKDGSSQTILVQAMAFTYYFTSIYFEAVKIFLLKRPKEPSHGYITSFLVGTSIIGIFSYLIMIGIARLTFGSKTRKKKQRRKRSLEAISRRKAKRGNRTTSNFEDKEEKDSFYDCRYTMDSKGASDTFHDCYETLHSKGEHTMNTHAFTTCLADGDQERMNTQVPFDTNSIFFVCDNSSTGHICNDVSKFVPGTMRDTLRRLTTANGTDPCLKEGTVRVHLLNGNSKRHAFLLENCIYLPESPVSLLSTRRLAEKFLDKDGNPDEDTAINSKYSTHKLTWCFGKYTKTFPTPVSGLPELLFDEGFQTFKSFCLEVGSPIPSYASFGSSIVPFNDDEIECDNMLFIADESVTFNNGKGEHNVVSYIGPSERENGLKHQIKTSDDTELLVDGVMLKSLDQPDISSVPITIEQYASELPNLTTNELQQIATPEILDNDQKELMELHCKMNHAPFPTLIKMAESNKIPKKLSKLKNRIPVCMSCVFGMSHRKPWRTKGTPKAIRKESETEPGDCISIDQLVSAQPGLIPQMTGFLTNMRIWGATVFVDHVTDYVYVALMRDLTLDETLLAKTSFERHANDGGVQIKAYRADNGRFADQGFRDSVNECHQTITYCAVGAHHQNGIVERRIKELTLIGRTLLLHAVRHWPGYITTMLWPFALKEAAYRMNKLSINSDGRSNEARFFGIDGDSFDESTFHVFGSPTFVLEAKLQSGVAGVPKWDPRSRLGIYVGHSPSHAGSVALVLNPKTGHVSPQYHIIFDDNFTTVPYMNENQVPPNWSNLVANSRELVTDEQFDLAKTWLASSMSQEQEATTNGIHRMDTNPTASESSLPSDAQITPDGIQDMDAPVNTNEIPDTLDNNLNNNSETNIDRPSMPSDSPLQQTQLSPVCEGESMNEAPQMINLETTGLRRSARLQQNAANSNSIGPTITAYTTTLRNSNHLRPSRTKTKLSFFSVFCSIGALWSFATSCMPHYHESKCHSFVARISNEYEKVNGLFDDTINGIIHHVKAFTTSNENFTYNEMLKEDDFKHFFQAMINKIQVHK